jgi:DNA-binding beta-propeller fold protein YncE
MNDCIFCNIVNGNTSARVIDQNDKAIAVGSLPTGIAYDSTNNHIYITNRDSNTVTMIHS